MSNLFGAKATIYLAFEGNIEALSIILSSKLSIPKFRIETDMDPPHK